MQRTVALWAIAVAAACIDCGGYQPPTLGACSDGTPLDEADCAKGAFVATDRCFESKLAACECLTCPADRCETGAGDPAEVSCALAEDKGE